MVRGLKVGNGSLAPLFLFMIMSLMLLSTGHVLAAENDGMCSREVLQAVVHSSGLSLGEILKDVRDDKKRTELVRRFVKSVRFFPDQSGYIYVYTLDGLVVGHGGMKNLEKTNLIDHRDAKGVFDVRLAIATAKKGGGFFEHYWRKPGVQGEFKKITYVEPVAATNYFIGAGAYIP